MTHFENTWVWIHPMGPALTWALPNIPCQRGALIELPHYGQVELIELLDIGIIGRYALVLVQCTTFPERQMTLLNYTSAASVVTLPHHVVMS